MAQELMDLRKLAEAATPEWREWFVMQNRWCIAGDAFDVQEYIAAANPAAVISLLDQIQTLQAENVLLAKQVIYSLGVTAERDALQAENERLKLEMNQPVLLSEWQKLTAERDALAAKLVPLEADAGRLNWLDKNGGNSGLSQTLSGWQIRIGLNTEHFDNLRYAIDAAKGGQHEDA